MREHEGLGFLIGGQLAQLAPGHVGVEGPPRASALATQHSPCPTKPLFSTRHHTMSVRRKGEGEM